MILFHQRVIPQYRAEVFRKLLERRPDIVFLYGAPRKSENISNAPLEDEVHFQFIRNYYFGARFKYYYSGLFRFLRRHRPAAVITPFELSNIGMLLLLALRRLYNYKVILWGHGWDRPAGFNPAIKSKDRLRLFLAEKADFIITYNNEARNVWKRFVPEKKLYVAPNTLNTSRLLRIRDSLEKGGRQLLKSRIGYDFQFNLIYVGRLEKRKNLALLLESFKLLKTRGIDVSLHVVGSGSEEQSLREFVAHERIEGVIFHGPIYDDQELGELIFCSDLMVIPEALGLSVVHAFCFQCPVLTMDAPGHGPEIEYVVNAVTGFVLPVSNAQLVSEKVADYLADKSLQQNLRANVVEFVKSNCSVDKMLAGFENVFDLCSQT